MWYCQTALSKVRSRSTVWDRMCKNKCVCLGVWTYQRIFLSVHSLPLEDAKKLALKRWSSGHLASSISGLLISGL